MIIKQLETGFMDNFCYIVGCESTRKALAIDPGADVDLILSDILLSDEEPLHLGAITFDVIHTPGHTPGGICLYAQGNLFTDDTLNEPKFF